MRFPRNAKIFRGQLDFAPVAAVLFLLVLFLLAQSSLVFAPGVTIRLPEADRLPGVTNATLVVAMDAGGQLYYENQVIDEGTLRRRLAEAVNQSPEPLTLVLQADVDVRHKEFVRLCELARAVGIREALVATRPRLFQGQAPGAAH